MRANRAPPRCPGVANALHGKVVKLRIPMAGTLALAFMALALPGCRPFASAARGPALGQAAPSLQAVLPYLRAARFPLYLPDRLPAPPPGDSYFFTAHATSGSYEVTFHFTNHPTPVNGTAVSSWPAYIGLVRGGPAAWVEQQAATQDGVVFPQPSGTPTQITLPGGLAAVLYPAGAVRWENGGWRYGVSADSAADAMHIAATMVGMFGPSGSPVGPGVHGEVLRAFGADGGNSAVLWTVGGRAYEVWGRDANAFTLVKDLVRVRT